jgi:hypothetical protein
LAFNCPDRGVAHTKSNVAISTTIASRLYRDTPTPALHKTAPRAMHGDGTRPLAFAAHGAFLGHGGATVVTADFGS